LKFRTTTSLTLLVLAWLPFVVASAELESFSEDKRLNFSLPDFRDEAHSLADYKGKVVLVNFWASWCPPCIYEMPELTRLKQQLADRPFEIIAINVGEKKYRVRKFIKLVNFELQVLLDTSNKTFNDWDVETLPTSFLIGADGRVRYKIRGNPGWEQQETLSLIEQLIAETATSAALND
jgi:thiol-disulfide isomerase/thioredoxin